MIRNSLMTGMHFLFCTVLIALFHFTVFYVIIFVYTPVMFLGEGLCALFSAWIMNGVLLQLEEISNTQNPQAENACTEGVTDMASVSGDGDYQE